MKDSEQNDAKGFEVNCSGCKGKGVCLVWLSSH